MMTSGSTAEDGGTFVHGPPDDLCLRFANTRYWRGTDAPSEELHAPADLLRWCEAAAVLDGATLGRARARCDRRPADADALLAEAIGLRETTFGIFAAIAAGGEPAPHDLGAFNAALRSAPSRARLRRRPDGYLWELPTRRPDAGLLLAPVLWSAADLLAGARLARVRQCANERCLWLFLDDSKSGNRRWCSMTACGNRAKAHRHYAKRKGLPAAPV